MLTTLTAADGNGCIRFGVILAVGCALMSTILVGGCSGRGSSARRLSHSKPGRNDVARASSSTGSVAAVVVPSMEVLYMVSWQDRLGGQIRVLRLPSRKLDVLVETSKMRERLEGEVGEAAFSPDGQHVLFTAWPAGVSAKAKGGYAGINEVSDLWIVDRRTKALRRLATDAQGYDSLQWPSGGGYVSADGFGGWTSPATPPTESGGCSRTLYVWDVQTGRRMTVVSDVNREEWAPNGKGLLALRNDWLLYVWYRKTGKKQLIASDVADAYWSTDSKGVYFRKNDGGVWYAPSSGTPVSAVPKQADPASRKDISPDSSRALNVSGGSGSVRANEPYNTELAITDAHTGKQIARLTLSDDARRIGWSKDGRTMFVLHSPRGRKVVNGEVVEVYEPEHILAVSSDTGVVRDLGTLPTPGDSSYAAYWDWRLVSD